MVTILIRDNHGNLIIGHGGRGIRENKTKASCMSYNDSGNKEETSKIRNWINFCNVAVRNIPERAHANVVLTLTVFETAE
jgi:hypothetical protein